MLKANVDGIATGILANFSGDSAVSRFQFYSVYMSLSLSLNVLLTFMIVVRLVLRGRNAHSTTDSRTGISGLYKSIATMLIESSALFAVSTILVIGPWAVGNPVANVFVRILAETQVRASPLLQSLDGLSNVRADWAGHCFTTHRSTGRRQERIDERNCRTREYQPVQS